MIDLEPTDTPTTSPPGPRRALAVVVPVFNDWPAAAILLERLDAVAAATDWSWHVLLVDDGSTDPPPGDGAFPRLASIASAGILRLGRNLGHQRAIAIGLAHAYARVPCEAVLVMDGDGEDAPADVPRLLAAHDREGGRRAIFAERAKRSEGLVFTLFYHLYRAFHWLLTGLGVRVGNFSVVPRDLLGRLMTAPDLWNHYAATVFNSRIPCATVPTVRATRFDGRSKMSFVSLVVHGLSAIAVYRDRVAVRLLILASVVMLLATAALVATVLVRLTTTLAIPGWATTAAGLSFLIQLQILTSMLVFVFVILGNRERMGFVPIRDHELFVREWRGLPGPARPPADDRP